MEETVTANATETSIIKFHEYENDESIHKPILKLLLSENPYDMTYVSFGSKENEESFKLPPTNITIYSNSFYQIIPQFIRSYRKILVICVDYFKDEEIEIHREQIKSIITNYSDVEQIDFIFIRSIVGGVVTKSEIGKPIMKNRENMKKLLESIIVLDNINEENFMCVNYIKFKRPNEIEENINRVYDDLFFELNKMKNVFYIWFGYDEYFYNLILKASRNIENSGYVYNFLKIQGTTTKKIMYDLIRGERQLNLSDIKTILQQEIPIPPIQSKYFKTLYNNCMDITHYMSYDNKMNKIQIEGGKRKTKKRTKKLYKRSKRKYKKCNSRI